MVAGFVEIKIPKLRIISHILIFIRFHIFFVDLLSVNTNIFFSYHFFFIVLGFLYLLPIIFLVSLLLFFIFLCTNIILLFILDRFVPVLILILLIILFSRFFFFFFIFLLLWRMVDWLIIFNFALNSLFELVQWSSQVFIYQWETLQVSKPGGSKLSFRQQWIVEGCYGLMKRCLVLEAWFDLLIHLHCCRYLYNANTKLKIIV